MAQFIIQDLTFTYAGAAHSVLRGIDLSVRPGEFVCLVGKSGCGKSTLLRQLKSVLTPTGERTGRVLFDGVPLEEVGLRDQSRLIGFVMQDPEAQVVTDKVWHELAFGLESIGCPQQAMRVRVAEMASFFGIQHWFRREVAELSGGQKQLLNLASVMAMQPNVLILDEPTAQLDPIAASGFMEAVRKVNRELGCTVLIAEHRLDEACVEADRVVVMDRGRVSIAGTPREVGLALEAAGDGMAAALPAPLRIFAGVEGAQECQLADLGDAEGAPLSVREGRTWLASYARARGLAVRTLEEEPAPGVDAKDAALSMEDVWFRYHRDAPDVLRGVDLRVPRRSLFALVGGNGAGKSTLLKTACGICKPHRGKVKVLGRPLSRWKEADLFRGGAALLPQDPQDLFAKRTVRADLEEMLSGLPADERARRIDEVARTCRISAQLDQHPFDLSGGELERAALAKVLLCEPELLLLDEPTKGLDAVFKQTLGNVLHELMDAGMTIVMVSHDVEFCARWATVAALLFDGVVMAADAPRAFFANNAFYTTAANRMSRQVFPNAVTAEEVVELCLSR